MLDTSKCLLTKYAIQRILYRIKPFFDSKIGAKYEKSVAQVALRFLLQNGVVVIPKSTHEERMQENFNVFDFVLTDEEMKQMEVLDTGKSLFFSHYSPETVEWFMSIV